MIEHINVAEKFNEQDFDLYFQLVQDENVMAMITERAVPLEEARKDYNKIIENNRLHRAFGHFKVIDERTGNFVGLAKLEIKEITDTETELGYMLLPEYWGRGIGSKVAKTLVDTALSINQIKRIYAIIDPKNIASKQILIRHGFKSERFQDFDGLPGEILGLNIGYSRRQLGQV